MKRDLLVYVYNHGPEWEALCVDLDIAVQAGSQHEAIAKMDSALASYITAALEEDSATQARLLSRRSPWSIRVSLWLQYQMFLWQRSRPHRRSVSALAVKCPA